MRVRRRLAGMLGLVWPVRWAEVEASLSALTTELGQARRDRDEMVIFLGMAQRNAYGDGVQALTEDVEIAIRCRVSDLPVPLVDHLRDLAEHRDRCPLP